MTIDATAAALAGVEPVQTEPQTEDEALSAAYDRLTEDGVEEAPEAEQEAPETEVTEAAEQPAVEPPPSDLPAGVKKHWAELPEAARNDFLNSHRDLSRKLADMGRQVQGISPIRDALVRAIGDLPTLKDMRPEQVASEVLQLAKLSHEFNAQPVQTIMGLIRQHKLEGAMQQALSGQQVTQQPNAALQNEIRDLRAQLGRALDPQSMREQYAQWSAEERTVSEVQTFAGKAEHWPAVENVMPQAIPLAQAKLGPSASPGDVLKAAYDMAVAQFVPDAKAKAEAATVAASTPDPDRAEAVKRATSVNVSGNRTGKTRELTEDEKLSQAYDRAVRAK